MWSTTPRPGDDHHLVAGLRKRFSEKPARCTPDFLVVFTPRAGMRRWPFLSTASLAIACILAGSSGAAVEPSDETSLRARVVSLTPNEPVRIYWRTGGEGFGGEVIRGELTLVPSDPAEVARLGRVGADYFPVGDKPGSPMWLPPGRWTPPTLLSALRQADRPPIFTFKIDGMNSGAKSGAVLKNVVVEFELLRRGKSLKSIVEKGPDGPTVTVRIPFREMGSGPAPAPKFVENTTGISEHARKRLKFLESLPWAHRPVPRRFAIITDCDGYAPGTGFNVRTTDKNVMLTELKSARQLGVNGLRSTPKFVVDMLVAKEGIGAEFSRGRIAHGVGYPVTNWNVRKKDLTAGCPYHPNMKGFGERLKAQAATVFSDPARRASAEELWLTEVDEIGSVFDRAPEKKSHQSVCPYCRQAFHDYLRRAGLGLADFGAKSWDDIRSTYGYWEKSYAEQQAQMPSASAAPSALPPPATPPSIPEPGAAAGPPPIVENGKRAPLSEKGWALLYNYSRRFNSDSSAMLLGPVREYFEGQNAAKSRALADGRLDSPEARQPWVYTYALRGVNFLIAGHSLEYFDFYRFADSGFMYETSNRDPRAWEWDSYMCDIGRILSDKMGKRFAVSVKPHRGAVIQRALTAASREAKMLLWYDFGPDWWKGDSFAEHPEALSLTSRAARLLAASEDVIYDAKWAAPAEIAVVRPRTSEFFENNASWENGKWIYTALQHQHLPVDPLDEGLLESEDLSRYKAIYVSGSHLRRSAANKLAVWVERGGVLFTSGWGLARDEANQPLATLAPVLGLGARAPVELWRDVWRYPATELPPLRPLKDPPPYATVTGRTPFIGSFELALGREVLAPLPGTEVVGTYGDGKPAVTRHRYGKGTAYVLGFYAGDEYGSDLAHPTFDMSTDFSTTKASFVSAAALDAGVRPSVDASSPLVEGILLKNEKTRKMAVSLINWAYKTKPRNPDDIAPWIWEPVPFKSVLVKARIAKKVRAATSAWTERAVSFSQSGDVTTFTLPSLDEADVLLLDVEP
jgi:hypothetical protein